MNERLTSREAAQDTTGFRRWSPATAEEDGTGVVRPSARKWTSIQNKRKMTPLYKVAVLVGLVVVYVLCCGEFSAAPRHYAQLFVMYLFGAVMALYMGEEIGKMPPVLSTRSAWIAAGVLLMGDSLVWMFALK